MADQSARDFGLFAQGLEPLLNRCKDDLLDGALHDVVIAHDRITSALRRGDRMQISVELLRDVARVITPFVDHATLDAARRCVEHIESGTPISNE